MDSTTHFWKRKAFGPESPHKKSFYIQKGWFAIRGPDNELDFLWDDIRKATEEGELGYFSNISDNNETIVVFHGNASNRSHRSRIQKKIFKLSKSLDVNVFYRRFDDEKYCQVFKRKSNTNLVVESQPNSDSSVETNQSSVPVIIVSSDEDSNVSYVESEEESDINDFIVEDSDEEFETDFETDLSDNEIKALELLEQALDLLKNRKSPKKRKTDSDSHTSSGPSPKKSPKKLPKNPFIY